LAFTLLAPNSQALAQSEQRQNQLNQTLQERETGRALDRQQDRNSANQQLQNEQLQRQLLQQQQADENLRLNRLPGGNLTPGLRR
jgi:exonuclease VII large subunit